ncbi:MAG TPA: CocE/NonD family hydrolase [Mycobacteriales bacterium]|nr:CocE/NonD family hydrolase [Mycobacteriales bacterium]
MSRHRLFAIAATAATAALAAGPLAVAGAAAPPPYTTHDEVVNVHDGPTDSHVTLMDTRLYLPNSATPAHPEPAIVMTNGFGLSKDASEITSTADFFARHGYVVLAYTGQGFGNSSGCIELDSTDYDVKDSMALITDILQNGPDKADVAHDARGPIVGLIGGSYGGGITLNVAEHDRRVRAIDPGRTWNSLQYALYPDNWVVPGDPTGFSHQLTELGVFKAEWTSLFYVDGNGYGTRSPSNPAFSGGANGNCVSDKPAADPGVLAGCTGYPDVLCTAYDEIATTGTAPASAVSLLAMSSAETDINALRVPTLLMQGESDTLFNEDDALATYLALKRNGVPVSLIWNYGGHGGYNSQPGECDVYGGGDSGLDQCYLPLRSLAWFDRYLKGEAVSTGPNFAYYRDWVPYSGSGPDTGQYGTASSFPAESSYTWGLDAGGQLLPAGLALASGSTSFVRVAGPATSYSETSNFTGPGSSGGGSAAMTPSDAAGTAVSFTSSPFSSPVVSVGVPTAHLLLSHADGQDLIFFGKVFDVAPDGTATLIKRLIAPVRIPNSALARFVNINLLGFAHLFPAGHAVRFTLAASDQTSDVGAATQTPDDITVYYGAPPGTPTATPNENLLAEIPKDYSWFTLPVNTRAAVTPTNAELAASRATTAVSGPQLPNTGGSPLLPGCAVGLTVTGLVAIRRWRPRPGA